MIPAMFLKVKYGKHLVGDRGEEKKIFLCPTLPVSVECPVLIAPSVFTNVYLVETISGSSCIFCACLKVN
jgi:hypothetical protein